MNNNAYIHIYTYIIDTQINRVYYLTSHEFNIYNTLNYMKIGIIGGGISGMAAALFLLKQPSKPIIHILQASNTLGGRIHSKTIQQCTFDVGANLIDFTQHQFSLWQQLMPEPIQHKLIPFTRPFLIIQGGVLKQGDLQKHPKYYYAGGFDAFIGDIEKELREGGVQIQYNVAVETIMQGSQQGQIRVESSDSSHRVYNSIILAVPAPHSHTILSNSPTPSIKHSLLAELASTVHYTKQISVMFMTEPGALHPYSCILFKDHPVCTFMCSHMEKYGGQNAVTVQLTEQFSLKYMGAGEQEIHQAVFDSIRECQGLPTDIRDQILGKQGVVGVKKWEVSLVKDPEGQAAKSEKEYGSKDTNTHDEEWEMVQAVGDWRQGKSRITGAIASVFKLRYPKQPQFKQKSKQQQQQEQQQKDKQM